MQTYFEYNRLPACLVAPVVQALMGVFYVRFSPVWQPACEALGGALAHQTKVGGFCFCFSVSSGVSRLYVSWFVNVSAAIARRRALIWLVDSGCAPAAAPNLL